MTERKKGQKDKQRSRKHTYETKERVTRTPLKPEVNSGAPEGEVVPAPLVAYYIMYNFDSKSSMVLKGILANLYKGLPTSKRIHWLFL